MSEIPSTGGMLKGNEYTSTAIPMRCTKCGRITTELHTDFTYPEEILCPECWRATQPILTFSRTESKEEIAYKKLKKWLKKENKKCKSFGAQGTYSATIHLMLEKMKELENEQ